MALIRIQSSSITIEIEGDEEQIQRILQMMNTAQIKICSHYNGVSLWVVIDSIVKGRALNAVQVAERLVRVRH